MTLPLHRVAVGLFYVTFGTVTVVLGLLLFVCSVVAGAGTSSGVAHFVLAISTVGTGLAFTGRCLGLAIPTHAKAVRAWAVLAVVLDGCGLFSGVVTFGTAFVFVQYGTSMPPVFALVGLLFSLVGLLLGRTAFHFYLWSLAKFIGDRGLAGLAISVFWRVVAVAGVGALSFWLLVASQPQYEVFRTWLVVVTFAILHWTWRYLRLLYAVRTAARAYTLPRLDSDNDPDRVYRERYEQGPADRRATPADER